MKPTNGAIATAILKNTNDTIYEVEITPVADGDIHYDIEKSRLGLGPTAEVALIQRTIVDTVAPTITISGVPSATDGTTPFTVTFAVSEPIFGFDADYLELNEISVTNGTASNLQVTGLGSQSSPVYTALVTPDGNGDVSVSVPANVINDTAANRNAATPVATALLDNAAPTVSISGVPSSVGTQPFTATFTVSEQSSGFEWNDVVVVNAFASTFDASNAPVFTALISPDGNGDVSVSVPENAMTDAVGNGNTASATMTATLDTAAPTVSISGVPFITNTTPFTTTFTVSEATSGFDINDVDVVNASVSAFDASNAPVFTAAITPDGNGDVSVSVAVDAMTDLVGNSNIASVVATAVLDTSAPEFSVSGVPAVTGTAPFTATFTISESVRGFTVDDLVLVNASVSSFDSTKAPVKEPVRQLVRAPVYTAVITPDGNGDVSVSVAAGAVQDAAGNANPASAVSTAVLDTTVPSVLISGVPAATATTPFTATFTISENVPDFTADDILLVNASASSFDGTSAPVYTAVITPDGNGDVSVSVPAGAVNDAVGNTNPASAVSTAVLDTTVPTITLTGVPAVTGTTPFTATFTVSEDVSDFTVEDLLLVNATASSFDDTSAPVYTAAITPDGNGDVSVSVAAGAVQDAAGNTNPASAVSTAVLDTTRPTVSLGGVPAITGPAGFVATITVSKATTGFEISDLVLVNASASDFDSASAPAFTVQITPDGNGDVSVSVPADVMTDSAGNPNAASAVATAVLDAAVPSITISGVPAITGTSPFTATFTISEDVPGFTVEDLVLVNATASSFDDTSAPAYTAVITPDGNGDVSVSVAAGAVQDAAGNTNPVSAVSTAVLDTAAPTVSIDGVPESTDPAGFVATITVSEATTGFEISDLVLVNANATDFDSDNAPVFTVQITPNGNGDVTLSVPADSMVDAAGIGNAASGSVTATLDTTAPSVSSIVAEDSDPTNGQLSWKVTFSEDVGGVSPENFNVEGVSGAAITVTPLGQTQGSLDLMTPAGFLRELIGIRSAHAANPLFREYLVTVTGGDVATITGSAVLVFGSAAGITDASGQGLVSITPTGVNQSTVNPDTDAPSVAQIVAPAQVEGAFDADVIFSEAVTGFDAADLVVTNATVGAVTPQAPVGGFATVFTVRLTPQTHGQMTIAVVASAAADASGNQSIASGTVTVSFLDANFVQARTGAVIRNFLSQRANNILSSQPDLSGRLMDQGGLGATEKFAVSTNYEAGSLQVNFAGSLTRLMSGQAISDMADEQTYGYGGSETGEAGEEVRTTRFNLWVKGNLSKSKLDGNEQGFGAFHVGADYRVTPDLMVGTLVQFDWADESNPAQATSASGTGWLAGPYAVYRLHQNVILDGYLAYGQSDNKVSPFGTYTDNFDTDRFLARGQITGDFDYAGWTVAPQLSASYLLETQKAYVDSNGVSIPEQDIEVGQLSFGPSFRKNHVLDNDVVLTPSLAVRGIWNFKKAGTANITTGALTGSAQDKLRARLELGVGAKFTDNFRLTSSGYVDGLGQNGYSGYGGTLGLNLRF
ncbi:MAG: Ig-like domain-containing protein [Hoeflea sp.]|uniref:Ig-like domain-containing protein n=1 Tax=Hoeflea sp. TaxID=1940281 RepID=UPI0032ED2DF6